jgi:hypothetical protein
LNAAGDFASVCDQDAIEHALFISVESGLLSQPVPKPLVLQARRGVKRVRPLRRDQAAANASSQQK